MSGMSLQEVVNAALPAQSPVSDQGIDFVQLILHASLPVQLVMGILLFVSIASWAIIFRKKRVIDRAMDEAEAFEERFWSGADLAKLQSDAERKGETRGTSDAATTSAGRHATSP